MYRKEQQNQACAKERKKKIDGTSFPSKDGVQTPNGPKWQRAGSCSALSPLLPETDTTHNNPALLVCLHALTALLASTPLLENASYHSP